LDSKITSPSSKWQICDVLVTVKAYPNPSKKYIETSCMAGITRNQQWIRLYPIPYRTLAIDRRFEKYTWVRVRAIKAADDHRPESYKVDLDSIEPLEKIDTEEEWAERRRLLVPLKDASMCELRQTQPETNRSLGFVCPRRITAFEIKGTSPQWTREQLAILSQQNFLTPTPRQPLEKIPYDFFYHFECEAESCTGHKMKIVDWELHQSYRNWQDKYGSEWESRLREKYEDWVVNKRDLHFFVGTMLRHPQTWIIVGLFYPPKPKERQLQLL
jgi:hypothetical protein